MGIYVGIGGWVFEEWRDNFYPKGLSQKRELEYASRKLTAIEINGTYYGSQRPDSFGMLAQTPQTRQNRDYAGSTSLIRDSRREVRAPTSCGRLS